MPDFLPRADIALLDWTVGFRKNVGDDLAGYHVPESLFDAFIATHDAYVGAMGIVSDPQTRTKPALLHRDTTRAAMIASIRWVAHLIRATPGITPSMLESAGLKTGDRRSAPLPAPDRAPVVSVESVSGTTVTLRLRDPDRATIRGKANGIAGAILYGAVSDEQPTEASAYRVLGNTTTSITRVTFDESLRPGTQVWVMAAYLNPRLQPGPNSSAVSAYTQWAMKVRSLAA